MDRNVDADYKQFSIDIKLDSRHPDKFHAVIYDGVDPMGRHINSKGKPIMIYEFLYKDKPPVTVWLLIVLFISTVALLTLTLYGIYSKNSTDADRAFFATVGILVTIVFGVVSIGSSAIYVYDKVTTPNENTKTTDLYKITKEKDYLTFSAKKPYNHLYKTKTMEITYTNSGEYVIITNNQTYKIPKESVSE